MSLRYANTLICCNFDTNLISKPDNEPSVVEVFFAKTKDLEKGSFILKNFTDSDDILKSERLFLEEDRKTYLYCHSIVKLILSERLNIGHERISIIYNNNGKPGLEGDPLFFNISHTREAFAFVISKDLRIGIDIEKSNRVIDINVIIKRFFSAQEIKYILESPCDSAGRFLLLWTRKEALLKAIGTGIISHLSQIEVLNPVNYINGNLFEEFADPSFPRQFYIYSRKYFDYYISIAAPGKIKINMLHLNEKSLRNLLH